MLQHFEERKQRAIERSVKSWIVPKAQELKAAGQFVPAAFLFCDCPGGVERIHVMTLSDQPTFHTQEHKDVVAAMVTATARRMEAWAICMVADCDYWTLHEDAFERLGMNRETFHKRAAEDYEWLCSVRDQVGTRVEALSFQFESVLGDWSGVLVYERHDKHGIVWHPLKEEKVDRLQSEGRFANLLPIMRGVGNA